MLRGTVTRRTQPLDDFASDVLDTVEAIPPGYVMSYGDIAEYLGRGRPRQVGRVLATSPHSAITGRRGTQVMPVGFFSVREALNCLTERLSVNPAQRHGAIDLI